MTTQIVALRDALGQLVRLRLLPGHHHDTLAAGELLKGLNFGALLADQAYDANRVVDEDRVVDEVSPTKFALATPRSSSSSIPAVRSRSRSTAGSTSGGA